MAFWQSLKSMGNLTFGSNKYEGTNNWEESMGKFTDLSALDIDGNELKLTTFAGKVLLITNVACKCGYTQGSYDKMQELAVKYADKGLRILCFPCNQFMSQEPWNEEEIKSWVTGKWPKLNPVLFSKIEVNGDKVHATYKYLKTVFPGDINWNFATKFVVGVDGIPVQRFDKKETWDQVEKRLEEELKKVVQSQDKPQEEKKADDKEAQQQEEKEADQAQKVEDKDKEQDGNEEPKEDDKRVVSIKDYVFKSMDKEKNIVTCLDNDFNDVQFDLDPNNAELLEKIEKVVEKGKNETKDVTISVSSLNDKQVISDAKV